VDYLADIVSKGGNLLLNVGPKADGTLPEVVEQHLRDVGSWLKIHGEAIYSTRPWSVYGEGPTQQELGSWGKHDGEYAFRAGDIRYTRKGDVLYAVLLEWPGEEVILKSVRGLEVDHVSLIGSPEIITWEQTDTGLRISLPSAPVSDYAHVLKLECESL
jgi:alpha-L-fucosidase